MPRGVRFLGGKINEQMERGEIDMLIGSERMVPPPMKSKRVARPRMLIEQFGAKCRCAGARENRSGCGGRWAVVPACRAATLLDRGH